jgi:hypothetical protein
MATDVRYFKRLEIPVILETCLIMRVKHAFTDVAEQNTPDLTYFDSSTAQQPEPKSDLMQKYAHYLHLFCP